MHRHLLSFFTYAFLGCLLAQAIAANAQEPGLTQSYSFPYFLPGSRIVVGEELVNEANSLLTKKEQLQFLLKILPPVDQKEKLLTDRQLYTIRLLSLTDTDAAVGPLLDRFEFAHKSDGWPAVHALARLGERSVEPVLKKLPSVAADRQHVATLNAALIEIKGKEYPAFIDALKRRKDVKLSDKVLAEMLEQYQFAPDG